MCDSCGELGTNASHSLLLTPRTHKLGHKNSARDSICQRLPAPSSLPPRHRQGAGRKILPRLAKLRQDAVWHFRYADTLLRILPQPRASLKLRFAASQELQARFNELLSSTDSFGLLVTIEKESLVPTATLPSQSASFNDNLPSLQQHLQPNAALYLILRRHEAAPSFLAVTYVPDAAPVRQKMLFASTRLTLVRELGSEHFRETIFTTMADELTAAGFQNHDAHAKLDAPLTDEEQTLGAVKRAEQEAGLGTGTREIHLSKSLNMPVKEDAIAAMKDVGQPGGRSVTMLVGLVA